jgi:hypothetical protein
MRGRLIRGILCVPVLLVTSVNQVWAACLNPPLSIESIVQFKSNPQALVAPDSDTRTIEATTRDLAGTDASLAADLVRVAQGTTPRFQTAIAAGLAQAAIACSTVDQGAAQLIQQAVAGFDDPQFQIAFAAVSGDLSTATAAAATSAESSVGSVVVTNPGSTRGPTTNFGGGGVSPIFQISSPGLTVGAVTPAATSAASPVSPSR